MPDIRIASTAPRTTSPLPAGRPRRSPRARGSAAPAPEPPPGSRAWPESPPCPAQRPVSPLSRDGGPVPPLRAAVPPCGHAPAPDGVGRPRGPRNPTPRTSWPAAQRNAWARARPTPRQPWHPRPVALASPPRPSRRGTGAARTSTTNQSASSYRSTEPKADSNAGSGPTGNRRPMRPARWAASLSLAVVTALQPRARPPMCPARPASRARCRAG